MEEFDPKKLSNEEFVRISMLKSIDGDHRLKEIEKKFQWAQEIKDERNKLKRLKELLTEVESIMKGMEKDWKLYRYDEENGKYYSRYDNEEIEDIEEFTKGKTQYHYKLYFKHYNKYILLRGKINSEFQELNYKYGNEKNEDELEKEEFIISDLKPRYQLLILYELGIIDHIKKELKTRDKNLGLEKRNYLSRLLGLIMNIENPDKTLRKELYNLLNNTDKTPANNNSIKEVEKILLDFGLNIKRLKK